MKLRSRPKRRRNRRTRLRWDVALIAACLAVVGCRAMHEPAATLTPSHTSYYKHMLDRIDFEEMSTFDTGAAAGTDRPRDITDRRQDELWYLTLFDAVQMALRNNTIVKQDAQFLSTANPVLGNPQLVQSIFDPDITGSGVLNGNRGVAAALSDFDPQLTGSMIWGRDEDVQNNLFSGGLAPGQTLTDETGAFALRLEKVIATGGSVAVNHNWNYSLNNVPNRLFGSAYTGSVGFEFNQPLLAGAGSEFTQIAGPVSQFSLGGTGLDRGILIAMINTDISRIDLEDNIQGLVKDVSDVYWDLALSFERHKTEEQATADAKAIWDQERARFDTGGATAADEAQAADNYFATRARAEEALATLDTTEIRLRRLLGLPSSDGRLIRPVDDAVNSRLEPDWYAALAEALSQRVELRRAKWNIKSLELQLKAARNLARPRLDFRSGYQINGFGDHLTGRQDNDGITTQGFSSAFETIRQGDQTGWDLGLVLSVPLGLRAEKSQIDNIELQLAKARSLLAVQESEVTHELSVALQTVERWWKVSRTNFERRQAAERRSEAAGSEFSAGRTSLDELVRAQTNLAQADVEYQRSVVEYTKAINDFHFRKGSILQLAQVFVVEPDELADAKQAEEDAKARAQSPDAAQPSVRK